MKLLDVPNWSRKSLQGITYWIGHRRSLYDRYPLGESAFVAEICNLIFAHLGKDYELQCEVMYKELSDGKPLPAIFGKRARADIVVSEKSSRGSDPVPRFVIEVKRGSAPTKEIDNDLQRLAAIARIDRGLRTMLFVVSEAKRLDRFVTSEGQSITGYHPIPDDIGHFRVRKTYKAAHAFKTRDRAQYASLLEVYPDPVSKPKSKRRQKL
jgi:hypothetical protein